MRTILTTQFDGDVMSVYNMIEEINEALKPYELSLTIDNEEHDGFDVVYLKDIEEYKGI